MTFKALLFVFLLVAVMTSPTAFGQLGFAQILGLINVRGILYCTANGNPNGTSSPVFDNALVQLQCGTGNTVASATTNGLGIFSIFLNPVQFLLTSLLSTCKLVVNTPLSSCNVTLPSVGGLISNLQLVENTIVGGLLRITNLIPSGFQFFANVN